MNQFNNYKLASGTFCRPMSISAIDGHISIITIVNCASVASRPFALTMFSQPIISFISVEYFGNSILPLESCLTVECIRQQCILSDHLLTCSLTPPLFGAFCQISNLIQHTHTHFILNQFLLLSCHCVALWQWVDKCNVSPNRCIDAWWTTLHFTEVVCVHGAPQIAVSEDASF